MSEIVERAAKAHYEASHDMRVELPWDECHPDYRAQKVAHMRAAIEAMREPTEAMIMSAPKTHTTEIGRYGAVEFWPNLSGPEDVYKAMIQAALKEPT